MKFALITSLVVHVGGLAMLPSDAPPVPQTAASIAEQCRCDYELTVTATQPPRSLTLGATPEGRFPQ